MAWDAVPWFVGGGAQHSPEVARLLAYAATGSAEGIVTPGDLKVTPTTVPGGTVNVEPGDCLIRNRGQGGDSQTYVGRLATRDNVSISATSGTARSDLIVAQIEDPFMAGEPWQEPADPAAGPYVFTRVIPNVPAWCTRLQDVTGFEGRTAITLARVDIPANTGTITSTMITDLRKLAMPRRERKLILWGKDSSTFEDFTSSSWTEWPTVPGGLKVDVPEWATWCNMVATINGAQHRDGHFLADFQIRFDSKNGLITTVDLDAVASNAIDRCYPIVMKWDSPLSDTVRGTRADLSIYGWRNATDDPGKIISVYGTQVYYDIEFLEQPE